MQVNEGTTGFIANGHFGTWQTAEVKEISGELFYRMEHEEYGDSVASIVVSQQGELVAEDLEHGFDQGAMEAIGEYFLAKGVQMEPKRRRQPRKRKNIWIIVTWRLHTRQKKGTFPSRLFQMATIIRFMARISGRLTEACMTTRIYPSVKRWK